jgi:hypothetical protein
MNAQPGSRGTDDLEHLNQMLERAPEPIRRPHGNHIEVAPDCGLEERVELRALVAALCAADALVLIDRVANALRSGLELLALIGGVLTVGGNAQVDCDALRPRRHGSAPR